MRDADLLLAPKNGRHEINLKVQPQIVSLLRTLLAPPTAAAAAAAATEKGLEYVAERREISEVLEPRAAAATTSTLDASFSEPAKDRSATPPTSGTPSFHMHVPLRVHHVPTGAGREGEPCEQKARR